MSIAHVHSFFYFNRNTWITSGSRRMEQFSINVGNTSEVMQHTQCAYQHENVTRGGNVTLDCNAVGRYVSFRREGGFEPMLVTICEFVVMGHPARIEGQLHISVCACIVLHGFYRMFTWENWFFLFRT